MSGYVPTSELIERHLRALWRCEGCGRTVEEGAQRHGHDPYCVRCDGRLKRKTIPLDMPRAKGRGGSAERRQLLLYWERRIWEAACRAFEVETDEPNDLEFKRRLMEFLATCAVAGKFLRVEKYIQGGDVPRALGCYSRHER